MNNRSKWISGLTFVLFVALEVFLSPTSLRAGELTRFQGGGRILSGYDSNVYQNFSQINDAFLNLGLDLAGNLYPGRGNRFQLSYLLDADWYFQEESKRMHQHEIGLKYIQRIGTKSRLEGGARGLFYLRPEAPEFGYRELFPYLVLRLDLPFLVTARVEYEYRLIDYPDYDLDQQGHLLKMKIGREVGLSGEIWLEGGADWAVYPERYVLDVFGEPASNHRDNLLVQAGAGFRTDLGSRANLSLGFDYQHNTSNANFYYLGPYGDTDPQVSPELISDYYQFQEISGISQLKFWPGARTELMVSAEGGIRDYEDRRAGDEWDYLKTENQTDLLAGAGCSWRQDLLRRKTLSVYWLSRANFSWSSSNDFYSDWWAFTGSTGAGVDF